MKAIPSLILTFIAVTAFARSQDGPSGDTPDPGAVITTARILGPIADGTPPPPAEPKPEYKIAGSDVLQTTTREQGGRAITIRRIRPIALPPPPPRPAETTAAVSAEYRQRLDDYRKGHPRSGLMLMGATVYRSGDQAPRTLIHLWPEGGGEAVELWSSADMALIAGGINSFRDSAGRSHHLMIVWSDIHVGRLSDIFAPKGGRCVPPEMPAFPGGEAAFQVVGGQPAAGDLTAIRSLHDIYNSELERLKTAREGRERARAEREAYIKSNPPKPQDITISYWRTETPASDGKGASK